MLTDATQEKYFISLQIFLKSEPHQLYWFIWNKFIWDKKWSQLYIRLSLELYHKYVGLVNKCEHKIL